MFWRGVVLCAVAGLLSGCATARTGFDYAAVMQKVGPPPPGQARVVVMSAKRSPDAVFAQLEIDGVKASRLTPGTYVYIDQPAGQHQILATETAFMGETRQDIATVAGRTYFLVAKPTERARFINSQIMMGGIVGALTATALTAGFKNPGPVDLFPLDEAAARMAIAELQLAE